MVAIAKRTDAMPWVQRGTVFYSSPDGRFDLWLAAGGEWWTATDWDYGNGFRGSWLDCQGWVRERTGGNQ